MGCRCKCNCGKVFLIIINVFVMILGVICFGGGLYLRFGTDSIINLLQPQLQAAASQSASFGAVVGSTSDLMSTFYVLSYVLIASGVFSLVVATIGCVGACRSVKVCLAIYAALVLLMFVCDFILILIQSTKAVDPEVFPAMVVDLQANYQGPLAYNVESLLLNAMMVQLQCCGIESYTEFQSCSKWDRTLVVSSYSYQQVIPVTCCKVTGSFPAITPIDQNCTIAPTTANANIIQGCHTAVTNQVNLYKAALYIIYAAMLIFELICACVAICLIVRPDNQVHPTKSDSNSKGQDQVESSQPGPDPGPGADSNEAKNEKLDPKIKTPLTPVPPAMTQPQQQPQRQPVILHQQILPTEPPPPFPLTPREAVSPQVVIVTVPPLPQYYELQEQQPPTIHPVYQPSPYDEAWEVPSSQQYQLVQQPPQLLLEPEPQPERRYYVY